MNATVDRFLRGEGRFDPDAVRVPWRALAVLVLLCGPPYGFAMGMFSIEPLQGIYSATKVPILLACTSAICLPSFYAINTVLGLREDFAIACRAVFAAQAAVSVALLSLMPVVVFCYTTTSDYALAVFSNGVMFAVATVAGQLVMTREYAMLTRRNPRHRAARRAWTVLYVFVAVQLAWVLRPFIGAPGIEVRFFREGAWSNAYVVVGKLIWSVLGGG